MAVMKHVGIAFAAVVLGLFLIAPLGMIFDRMNWPVFHSWGLAHGSFLIAWPLLTLFSFGTIEGAISFRQNDLATLRLTVRLLLVWMTSILIACLLLAIGYRVGKAGDCRPGQIDGQCGLSTLDGLLKGAGGGIVILVCATVYTGICIYRRAKSPTGLNRISGE